MAAIDKMSRADTLMKKKLSSINFADIWPNLPLFNNTRVVKSIKSPLISNLFDINKIGVDDVQILDSRVFYINTATPAYPHGNTNDMSLDEIGRNDISIRKFIRKYGFKVDDFELEHEGPVRSSSPQSALSQSTDRIFNSFILTATEELDTVITRITNNLTYIPEIVTNDLSTGSLELSSSLVRGHASEIYGDYADYNDFLPVAIYVNSTTFENILRKQEKGTITERLFTQIENVRYTEKGLQYRIPNATNYIYREGEIPVYRSSKLRPNYLFFMRDSAFGVANSRFRNIKIDRNILSNQGAGTSMLITELAFLIHPIGFTFAPPLNSYANIYSGPTNEELNTNRPFFKVFAERPLKFMPRVSIIKLKV